VTAVLSLGKNVLTEKDERPREGLRETLMTPKDSSTEGDSCKWRGRGGNKEEEKHQSNE